MQIGTPSLRNGFANPVQSRQFAVRNPAGGFSSATAGHDSSRENSGMREIAASAIAALAPTRFTASQRQTAQRQGGITAIAAAQRMQGPAALR
jgi:hypothetical protein